MDFISISEVIKKRAGKSGRLPIVNSISITQIYHHEKTPPSRHMSINIPEDIMVRARFKKGDRIDIGFTEDGVIWRLKVVPQDALGYSISTPSHNARRGVIRLTWCEGIPLLGKDEKVIKARAIAQESSIKVSPAEVVFHIGEVRIESTLKE